MAEIFEDLDIFLFDIFFYVLLVTLWKYFGFEYAMFSALIVLVNQGVRK